MINKIKDFFDVIKYKRRANTALNKYEARNSDYIDALETVQTLTKEILNYQKQIAKLKQEKKDLKRVMEEDMIPKKNKNKKSN